VCQTRLKLSWKGNECKPLPTTVPAPVPATVLTPPRPCEGVRGEGPVRIRPDTPN